MVSSKSMKITKPTLIIDEKKAAENIGRMMKKISLSGDVRFRPHFKTHQSARIGELFRDAGNKAITVSSVSMAEFFAGHGWENITIAVLVNPLEIDALNELLARNINLNLLVDSVEMVNFLEERLEHPVKLWIKIDTGYHRTGIEWDREKEILQVAEAINRAFRLRLSGILTHSGHAYHTISTAQIKTIYDETVTRMNAVRTILEQYLNGKGKIEVSIGDTPTCSVVDRFEGVDEVRPGNFVYYDVMQLMLGACREENIAAAAVCPVIARYPQRNELVIYGGTVHLSKEFVTNRDGNKVFGLIALPDPTFSSWGRSIENTFVSSLSQEHGIIKTTAEFIQKIKVGDLLAVLPVHSCLTANLLR
jgi:D-serine deaminase-like pyridoxal phosphate-dependent protein